MAEGTPMYICKNLDGECEYALNKTQFPVRTGEDLKCPKCGKRDIELVKPTSGRLSTGGGGGGNKRAIIITASVVLLAALGWWIFSRVNRDDYQKDNGHQEHIHPGDSVNTNVMTFSYTPSKPSGIIHTKGVIELGATAFDAFVIRMDEQKNWERTLAKRGRAYTGLAGSDEVVKKGLRDYIGELIDFGVKGNDIHFVVSSGAHMSDTVRRIEKILTSIGYVVNVVSAQQEGEYGLRAVVPNEYYDRSVFFVDIGSGNTKIAWKKPDGKIGTGSTWGSKYYEKDIADQDVRMDAKSVAVKVPADKQSICFVIGGIPYELANQTRKKEGERYTCLQSPNVYTPDGQKQRCGLLIYEQIWATTGCRHFIFDWDTSFVIGFLLYGVSF